MATLEERGVACRRKVDSAVKKSQDKLDRADTLVRRAREKKQQGDLVGARQDLSSALEVYPKYYWAQKQLDDLEQRPDTDSADSRLRQRKVAEQKLILARQAEDRDDLVAAANLTLRAMDPVPRDPDLRAELVEYARLLGLKLFSDGQLTMARNLWGRGLDLDANNAKLRQYLREVDQRLESLEEIKAEANGIPRP
jgi:tetratricopeptide (TPR) repeat protein